MANHVYSVIDFHVINDEAKARLIEMYNRCEEQDYGRRWFADMFVAGDITYDDVKQYSWTTENIGPKWCYIEEFDQDDMTIRTESAWSPPESGVMKLVKELNKLDDKIVWSMRYEDEMPNFIGAYVYTNDEVEDGAEDDDEDIRNMIFHRYPEIAEGWDEDDECWRDDEVGEAKEEEFREVLYEWICERQDEIIDDTVSFLIEGDEE